MNIYQAAMTAESGQVLGKAFLSQLRDNRDYFFGLVARYRTVNEGVNEWHLCSSGSTVWDGWHLLRSDAKLLHYYMKATNCQVKLYYDNVLIDTATNATKDTTSSLAAKDAGLYRVHFVWEETTGSGEDWLITPPWTTYTSGSTSYTARSVSDASAIAAADFTTLKSNDAHWNLQQPPQPPFVIHENYAYTASATTVDVWEGRITHYGNRLYYKIELELETTPDSSDNTVRIYYSNMVTAVKTIQEADLDANGICEGSCAISGSGDVTVKVVMSRSDDVVNATTTVWYLYTAPYTAPSWSAIGDYTVGQYIYGSTAGQSTRVQNLFANDATLATYLHRKDFASRSPTWSILGKDYYWTYWFIRRYDLLYYRGTGCKINYGTDQSATLPDVETGTYNIYDLNNVSNLHPGMMYELSGDLEFAQEAPW